MVLIVYIGYEMIKLVILRRLSILLMLLSCAFYVQLEAFHIIGGEVTYECLGSVGAGVNRYEFKMFIYRDCKAREEQAADLDPEAIVRIYRGLGTPYQVINTLGVPLSEIIEIDPPEIECLIPPDDLCVQRGFYTWVVDLPVVGEDYHLTYQRCCRNSTISNIIDPNGSGATYTMQLKPEAQNVCNNSPTFKEFPPTIVCVNEPVSFDHSALDSDGDSLTYEFVSPLLGGSRADPQPIAEAPPYQNVIFRSPVFSAQLPLAGGTVEEGPIRINSETGEITGIPLTQGQFVVGVRVLEYRDGVLIGDLTRDFQFNVESCESLVIASIEADSQIGDKQFAITSCGQQTVAFNNLSTVESQIFSYEWSFPTGEGSMVTSAERDATITFPDTGLYQGWLYLNRASICEDSASINVRILPATIAGYVFEYDTCVVGPVSFVNESTTEATNIISYEWDFGGLGSSSQKDPIFNFPEPSTQPVTLMVRDNNNCTSVFEQDVIWQPAPQTIIVQPSTFLGCKPANINFLNLSAPIDETYTFNWDFGDGNTGSDLSPDHVYEQSGVYDVSLEIISPIGCQVEDSFRSLIRVEEGPTANFAFTPNELTSLNSTVQFIDQSSDAAAWFWNFDDEGFSVTSDPIHTFQDTGMQEVRLIVTRDNGCQDTIIQNIDVIPIVLFHMPNAFTPNEDGANEEFRGKGVLDGMTDFQFSIWNRWGEQVFFTRDPQEGWNGRKNNVGAASPIGSYPYLVTFVGPRGEPFKLKGQANLIK